MAGKETYFMDTWTGKHENEKHSKIIKLVTQLLKCKHILPGSIASGEVTEEEESYTFLVLWMRGTWTDSLNKIQKLNITNYAY
jgi:hypothetical protein